MNADAAKELAGAAGRRKVIQWASGHTPGNLSVEEAPRKYARHLYGNAGKRKAVEQFFLMILQEKKPQTLLLFSDESMAWLYEDPAFSARWMELFKQVILKGNRVRIIHTVWDSNLVMFVGSAAHSDTAATVIVETEDENACKSALFAF